MPPKDDIFELLGMIKILQDKDVLLITSKILAIHQGRCIEIGPNVDKTKLIKREAQKYKITDHIQGHRFILTVKQNTLIPSAGIDESNGNGYYILWPAKTVSLLKQIHRYLTKKHKIKNLGLIATDSHLIPLRRGVVGISIGFYGFEPLNDHRGEKDIFGRTLKYTQVNVVDPLAAIGVLLMGESSERTPMFIIRGLKLKYTRRNTYKKLLYPYKQDLYYPLLRVFDKKAKSAKLREN